MKAKLVEIFTGKKVEKAIDQLENLKEHDPNAMKERVNVMDGEALDKLALDHADQVVKSKNEAELEKEIKKYRTQRNRILAGAGIVLTVGGILTFLSNRKKNKQIKELEHGQRKILNAVEGLRDEYLYQSHNIRDSLKHNSEMISITADTNRAYLKDIQSQTRENNRDINKVASTQERDRALANAQINELTKTSQDLAQNQINSTKSILEELGKVKDLATDIKYDTASKGEKNSQIESGTNSWMIKFMSMTRSKDVASEEYQKAIRPMIPIIKNIDEEIRDGQLTDTNRKEYIAKTRKCVEEILNMSKMSDDDIKGTSKWKFGSALNNLKSILEDIRNENDDIKFRR